MAQGKVKRIKEYGFTLIEVMIALMIFATFATVYVTGEGYNLIDSGKLKDDILLKDLAENKINEIVINPPEFQDSLTMSKETKDFDNQKDYQYTVEYKKFFVPDFKKIAGDTKKSGDADSGNGMEQKLYNIFKENMEKMVWQVQVTVKNKTSEQSFSLSSWLYNQNAEVKIAL